MTKLVQLHLYDFKVTKAGGWFRAPEGERIINPEVQIYMTANKVKRWEILHSYIPATILLEVDE